ncbi:MAG TPA: hypothetical protein VGN13_05620 [Solirubrobacteraceae bacterium]
MSAGWIGLLVGGWLVFVLLLALVVGRAISMVSRDDEEWDLRDWKPEEPVVVDLRPVRERVHR